MVISPHRFSDKVRKLVHKSLTRGIGDISTLCLAPCSVVVCSCCHLKSSHPNDIVLICSLAVSADSCHQSVHSYWGEGYYCSFGYVSPGIPHSSSSFPLPPMVPQAHPPQSMKPPVIRLMLLDDSKDPLQHLLTQLLAL